MLTYEDAPTIEFAIRRRLDKEPGIKIVEIKVEPHLDEAPPFIAVGVLAEMGDGGPIVRSLFHLPSTFDLRHVHNEVDEIAEQYKVARKLHRNKGNGLAINPQTRMIEPDLAWNPQQELLGTGLRGRWAKYG